MIDEKTARVTSAALMILTIAHDAGISDDDTFAACEYILGTRRAIAENNVIQLRHRGRVEAPSRASRQPSDTGASGAPGLARVGLTPPSEQQQKPEAVQVACLSPARPQGVR